MGGREGGVRRSPPSGVSHILNLALEGAICERVKAVVSVCGKFEKVCVCVCDYLTHMLISRSIYLYYRRVYTNLIKK